LVEAEAAAMLSAISTGSNGLRIIAQAFENRDVNDIRLLAQKLTMQPGTIALLGVAGEKAQLIFSRSDDVGADMAQLLKTVLAALGSDRGGGRPNLAQGGGIPASLGQLTAAIRQSAEALRG
jgi:alanyl-tRNA synthetase